MNHASALDRQAVEHVQKPLAPISGADLVALGEEGAHHVRADVPGRAQDKSVCH